MKTVLDIWKSELAKQLTEKLGIEVQEQQFVLPPNPEMGDISIGCFAFAKAMGKSPADIAKSLASELVPEHEGIVAFEAAGPYLNVRFSNEVLVRRTILDIEETMDAYGAVNIGQSKSILLEYASLNTHKEIHVGHLRNLFLGRSAQLLLEKAGYHVIPVSYQGDVGAHVAKCLWYFVKDRKVDLALTVESVDALLKDVSPEQATGKYLGQVYTQASAALEEHPEYKDESSAVLKALESGEPAWTKLWLETRRWCLEEMLRNFDELDVRITRQYLESEVVARGQEMVDVLIEKGVATESQGATVVDLEDVKLGVFLVRKSDGNSLYSTKDIALAELKKKEFPLVDKSIILVDNRQSFYFKQLFEVLKRMGLSTNDIHVGYDFVTLKEGAMSSRKGNIITYQDFVENVTDFARAEIIKRHEDWSEGKVTHTAWCLAQAGLKFGMLRQDNDRIYVFDMEQAMAFDGDTGPYCQYAATRLHSIIRKAGGVPKGSIQSAFSHPSEKILAQELLRLPKCVEQAAAELRPSVVAQWCIDVSHAINAFYRDVPVIEASPEDKAARLRLSAAALQGLKNGLALLSIPLPEEM
ncbi:MAG: arginine--tRNA ligase [Candidatus Magasanikbacteria bacterium]|nr:arginine--tRNA ligase [Candidatus Magasanikbacteria bacterium]